MSGPGDQITTLITREFLRASAPDHGPGPKNEPLKVVAATTVSSVVAALAARRLGADGLAIASGFGTLDAAPVPTLSLLESGLGSAFSAKGPPSDTFVAVAKGWVGVVVVPAQLDARCRTNLSRIGGSDDRPAIALPGSRGLPDNNASPSRVWYLLPQHSSRELVTAVDFVSGPEPEDGQERRLITNLGVFAYGRRTGWVVAGLFDGVDATHVVVDGFPIGGIDDADVIAAPSEPELEALSAADPDGMRHIEFLGREAVAASAELITSERERWEGR